MTMTLETMLAWCNEFLETAPDARNVESMRDGIRAAILDRDADRFTASNQTLRAERAEAELATAQNTINAQQDTMGALKRKLALSEGELAALKARISEAPVASVRVDDRMHVSIGARSNAVDFVPLHTKHGALVKVED